MHVHKILPARRWKDALAIIENGKYGLAFSSGVGATDAVIKLLSPGD
ncbi:MAG: hypothetical protein WDO71_09780 [Bacteroidota bacterium]